MNPYNVYSGGRGYGKTFQTNQIVQNTRAELCLVCRGTGKYKEVIEFNPSYTSKGYIERTCHGCGGKGWVVVAVTYGIR